MGSAGGEASPVLEFIRRLIVGNVVAEQEIVLRFIGNAIADSAELGELLVKDIDLLKSLELIVSNPDIHVNVVSTAAWIVSNLSRLIAIDKS